MPRKAKYVLGDAGDGTLGVVPAPAGGGAGGFPSVPSVPQSNVGAASAIEALAWFDTRTDGWLRVIPAGDGKQGYAKWKFTSGQWRGYYVMYVGPAGDVGGRLVGLAGKLWAVDQGLKRPALDSYGGDGWESA